MVPSTILTALKEVAQHLGKKMDAIKAAIADIKVPDISDAINKQTRTLGAMATQLNDAVNKVSNPKFTVEANIDTHSLESKVDAATSTLSKLKIPTVEVIETALYEIYECLEDQKKMSMKHMEEMTKAIKAISLAVPDKFKIDDQQMRAITGSMSSMPMNGGAQTATRVTNTTVAATASNTEYTYTFPSATLGWVIKLRDQGTLAYYSWTTGKLPSSGDGTTYMTIPQNFLRSQDGVDYSGKTIYLGAETNSQTFEIEVFRA